LRIWKQEDNGGDTGCGELLAVIRERYGARNFYRGGYTQAEDVNAENFTIHGSCNLAHQVERMAADSLATGM